MSISSAASSKQAPRASSSRLISFNSVTTLWRALTLPDEELTAEQAASTLFRFFRSNHVIDLRLIFGLAVFVFLIHLGVIVGLFSLAGLIALGTGLSKAAAGFKLAVAYSLALESPAAAACAHAAISAASYIAPALPVYGAVLAWSYLSALKRLGVVDLFACEIGTLCRVGTIFDVGKRYIEMSAAADHRQMLATADHRDSSATVDYRPNSFVSQEDYFPVFAKNSQDLQSLEALVVGNITEFYTYMKAMRDAQRKLQVESPEGAPAAMLNVIYMLFLGYESARKAIKHLVEFQPTQTGYVMGILLTELTCYSFLCKNFTTDQLRFSHLALRLEQYATEVPALIEEVERHCDDDKDWGPAQRTLQELKQRYKDTLAALHALGLNVKSASPVRP